MVPATLVLAAVLGFQLDPSMTSPVPSSRSSKMRMALDSSAVSRRAALVSGLILYSGGSADMVTAATAADMVTEIDKTTPKEVRCARTFAVASIS